MKDICRKNVVLADCPAEEVDSFLSGLNATEKYQFECISEIACGIRKGVVSELKRYFNYFRAAWHAFRQREQYQIIMGWQQFYALIFCFYCRIFRVKKQNTTVALNFTYKDKHGLRGRIYLKFMRMCLEGGYLDYIHVPSHEYADEISRKFRFPREHILVTHFGVDDIYICWKDSKAPEGFDKNQYAVSIGRSNRDFELLLNAWKNIDFPLILISDTFKPKAPLPGNVTFVNNVAGNEQYPYIANAKLVFIPIKDGKICSGDTVLLTAMSFERNVVVTTPSTLGEMYIQDGVSGYLVEKNEEKIATLLNQLFTGMIADVGEEARRSYLDHFSRFAMGKKIAVLIGDKENRR